MLFVYDTACYLLFRFGGNGCGSNGAQRCGDDRHLQRLVVIIAKNHSVVSHDDLYPIGNLQSSLFILSSSGSSTNIQCHPYAYTYNTYFQMINSGAGKFSL